MDAANQLSDLDGDLAACELEPLQFIGSIQSIGGLIAFTAVDQRIQAAAENISEFFDLAHLDVVSQTLEHVLGAEISDKTIQLCRTLTIANNRIHFTFEREGKTFDAAVFSTDGLHFLEFEHAIATTGLDEIVRNALIDLRDGRDLRILGTRACRAVQQITGVDRVMLYRFLKPHNHGEVIAEHLVLTAHSYNQHRFPASDIPQIARSLYLRNNVRQIPDINLPTSKVLPGKNPLTGRALDLSDSRLRAVSPIHLEYLRNMKVECSFSVAVIVDGELWGLIACHHLTAKRIVQAQRSACEIIAHAFAGQARLVEVTALQNSKVDFLTRLSHVFESVLKGNRKGNQLLHRPQMVFDAFNASGMAVVRGGQADFAGLCPPRADLVKYADEFAKHMTEQKADWLATETLSQDFPALPQYPQLACGVVAVKLSGDGVAFLFRPELIERILWGGDPRKQLDQKKFEGRINPRTSFASWEEVVRGRSAHWADFEIAGFQKLKDLIFEKP